MISKETEAEVLRLYHAEKWRLGTIAAARTAPHDRATSPAADGSGIKDGRASSVDG